MSEPTEAPPAIANSPEPAKPLLPGLSVILPARNVASTVEQTLRQWLAFLATLERDYEILLVDDGSSDETAARVEQLQSEFPWLKLLRHFAPRGFGAALRTAIPVAQHPLIFYSSCNRRYRPDSLSRFLEKFTDIDLISGYRAGTPVPVPLRILGACWRWSVWILFGSDQEPLPGWLGWKAITYQKLIRAIFGVRIGDIDSEYKLFRRSLFDQMPIQSDGVFVHAEILAKANFQGRLMAEEAIPESAEWDTDSTRMAELRRVFHHPDFRKVVEPGKTVTVPKLG